jgi:DNA-binding CsgD family transcriptional regulator
MLKQAAAVADIRELCQLGIPGPELMPCVLERLHRLVPSYTSLFDWVDDEGRILHYYTEPPLVPEVARLYFDAFYNDREREVVPAYSEQIRRGHGVVNRGAPDRAFCRSDFYNLIWRPRGVHQCLEAVVRHRGRPVGALTLYRAANEPAFDQRDERALASVLPYFAQAVAASPDYRGRYVRSGEAGLLVVDRAGRLSYLSAEGRRLLYMARRAPSDAARGLADAESAALPGALLAWCRDLAHIPAGASMPVFAQQSAWGKFVFRGYWLEPSDAEQRLIAIEIERHLPQSLNIAQTLRSLPLSARQRQLCALLADGLAYAAVAARMNITTHTAISYARLVYEKLGLSGREELVRMLLAPPPAG